MTTTRLHDVGTRVAVEGNGRMPARTKPTKEALPIMANTAHYISASATKAPVITVRDDRGAEIVELELPSSISDPGEAEGELREAGWTRSAEWTTTDDGWVAPVVPS